MKNHSGPTNVRGSKLRDIFYKARGEVQVVAKNTKTGEIHVLVDDRNLVVNVARNDMSRLIAGDYTDGVSAGTLSQLRARCVTKMSWGSGGHNPLNPTEAIPPVATDVALAIELVSPGKKVVTHDYPNTTTVRFIGSLDETEANGQGISECGLWTEDNPDSPGGNLLFARKTFGLITKTADFVFEFRWKIIF
jgi:hypothetical protein